MKYRKAARLFIERYKNPFTIEGYSQTLVLLKGWIGEEKDIRKVTTQELLDFANAVRSKRKDGQNEDYAYAPMTAYRHIKQMKIFFNFLTDMGFIESNVGEPIPNPRPRLDDQRNKAMTVEEFNKMLPYAYPDPLKDAMFRFLWDTGCRAGGVSALLMKNLKLEERKAFVTEKGGKSRWVYFQDECAYALERYLKTRPATVALSIERGYYASDHGYVFAHDQGPYKPDAVSQMVYRLSKQAGLTRVLGSHSMRHAFGHRLADSGIAPSTAAKLMGHSSPSITISYYYPYDDARAEEAAQKVGYQSAQSSSRIIPFKTG